LEVHKIDTGWVLMVIETEKLLPRPDLPTNRRSLNFATWKKIIEFRHPQNIN
jgi:hypothetical protein